MWQPVPFFFFFLLGDIYFFSSAIFYPTASIALHLKTATSNFYALFFLHPISFLSLLLFFSNRCQIMRVSFSLFSHFFFFFQPMASNSYPLISSDSWLQAFNFLTLCSYSISFCPFQYSSTVKLSNVYLLYQI